MRLGGLVALGSAWLCGAQSEADYERGWRAWSSKVREPVGFPCDHVSRDVRVRSAAIDVTLDTFDLTGHEHVESVFRALYPQFFAIAEGVAGDSAEQATALVDAAMRIARTHCPPTHRADACANSPVWARVPLAATNAWVARQRAGRDRRDRSDDAMPLLRVVGHRGEFAALLGDLGLARAGAQWAELGVLKGEFSRELLARSNATLHLVDVWRAVNTYGDDEAEANYATCLRETAEFGARARVHRMTTREAAERFADGSLDFVYVDASHKYADARADIEAWWPKVKAGGLMAGDDYYNGYVPLAGYTFGVKDAVDEFAAARNHRVYISGQAWMDAGSALMQQWYMLKCAD